MTTLIAQEKNLKTICHGVKNTSFSSPFSFYECTLFMLLTNMSTTCTCVSYLVPFLLIFTSACLLLIDNFFPIAYSCTTKWSFCAMYANSHHYVAFLCHMFMLHCMWSYNSARWSRATHVSWDLASVTCLGIFACWLMCETHYN